jgi:hypothetical protein
MLPACLPATRLRLQDAARKQAAEPKPGRAPAAGPVDLLTDDLITLNVADDVPSHPTSSSPLRATSISSAAAQQAQLPRPPQFLSSSGGSGVSVAGAAGAAAGASDAPGSPHLAQQLSWGRVFTSQHSIGSAAAAQVAEGAAALAPSAAVIAAAQRASAVARSPVADRAGPLPRTSSSRGSGGAVPAAISSSSSSSVAAGHAGQQVQHQAGTSEADRQLWGNAGGGSGGGSGSLRAEVASTAAAPLPMLPTVVQTAAAARGTQPPVADFSDLVHGLR